METIEQQEQENQSLATFGQGLFSDKDKLLSFLFAGNATFTIKSKRNGKRFTYKLTLADSEPQRFFVSVLNGPDNWSNYQYLGLVFPLKQIYTQTSGSKISSKADSAVAISWFFSWLFNPLYKDIFQHAEVWHEGKCGRCGRKLTVPESIESGFGPECIGKI